MGEKVVFTGSEEKPEWLKEMKGVVNACSTKEDIESCIDDKVVRIHHDDLAYLGEFPSSKRRGKIVEYLVDEKNLPKDEAKDMSDEVMKDIRELDLHK